MNAHFVIHTSAGTTIVDKDVESVQMARGIAKIALRKSPFNWEHAYVFVDGKRIHICKGKGTWEVTEEPWQL